MSVKIADLMADNVITATPHQSVTHVRDIMARNGIHAVPVVDPDMAPLGIVTTTDLADKLKDDTPVSQIMTRNVTVVPAYNDASAAARIMRKNRIHHVVVTHEKSVVGIISSFDLLQLVEGHRFIDKNEQGKAKKSK